MSPAPRVPRFVLVWKKSRNSEPVIIAWTWTKARAVMLAGQFEWQGSFSIQENLQVLALPVSSLVSAA